MGSTASSPAAVRARVLLNARAGSGARPELEPEALQRRFAESGVDADVEVLPRQAFSTAARRAVEEGAAMVVAAGGDGTVGSVAAPLIGTSVSLGVLPVGTRNHFARDLGIPTDVSLAIDMIARGRTRTIDVGDVNGHVFVNNASIGLYPEIVEDREEKRRRFGWSKTLATLWAAFLALRRLRVMRVRLAAEGHSGVHTTPFVFVGNNEYNTSLFALGQRARLDEGMLSVYTANVHRPFALVHGALMTMLGRLDQARDFEQRCVAEAWLDSRWRRLRVALDGEVILLAPPLHFRTRPGALRVLVPDPP